MVNLIAFLLICSGVLAVDFKPPTASEMVRAIGNTEGLPQALRKALDPGPNFEPIPAPKPGDWLAVHRERGQTFDAFVESKSNRPGKIRRRIYLQPLGEFPQGQIPLVERLKEYAKTYFVMDVNVLEPLTLNRGDITTRTNPHTRNRQVLTGGVLAILRKQLPGDAFCLLAITMEDLYPDPSWNFVFGQATLRDRVGVYSFVRYDPAFYGEKRAKDYEKIVLLRSCKVLAHETAHMFGLTHCIYFRCVLNGSNHLAESDSRPHHLCPVCLRKLHYSIGFDVANRYGDLLRFHRKVGFDDEARWLASRLEWTLGKTGARQTTEQETPE
ncbi:MAG: archaemetzincin [Planctomycetota bacterium]|jgi:archaemetzincin